jgi:hypothetical protein
MASVALGRWSAVRAPILHFLQIHLVCFFSLSMLKEDGFQVMRTLAPTVHRQQVSPGASINSAAATCVEGQAQDVSTHGYTISRKLRPLASNCFVSMYVP